MTRLALIGALLLLLAYGFVEIRPLLSGPALTIGAPADGARAEGGLVTVAGRAWRAASLTLDGAPLLPDQNGRFSSTLAFPAGTSILTLVATDRFGKSVVKTRTIYTP